MEHVLSSKENDCRGCYKCIRGCPTKSIAFHHGQASIIPEECVLCGRCFEICPESCKTIRDDIPVVHSILSQSKKAVVSLAPSFFSAFPGVSFSSIKAALLKLGFFDVEETALGATSVKKAYDELVEKGDKDILISTACHSVNLLFEKHYPELLPYLCPVVSPMLAHAKAIKEKDPSAKVVFIGPCIAKKDEADKHRDLIDAALTYLELQKMFDEADIVPEIDENNPKEERSLARLFPLSGGILDTMEKKNKKYDYICVDGMERCLSMIQEIKEGKIHNAFIEMSACAGSCIGGPAMKNENRSLYSGSIRIKKMAGEKDFDVKDVPLTSLTTKFENEKHGEKTFSEEDIAKVLASIGKTSKKDELNCSCCGYPSCRAKAIAVLEGKASLEMCLPYLMKKSQSFSNTIVESIDSSVVVLDDDLTIELANPAAAKLFSVRKEMIIGHQISEFLDPECFGFALGGNPIHHRKLRMLNGDKIVEGSIIYVAEYHILIALLNDVTKEEKARISKEEMLEKTAKITSEVVDKNMRAVQEIASLLGETTAETKIALTKLRDVLENEKDD